MSISASIAIRLQSWNIVNDSNGSWPIDTSGDALFIDPKVIFFEFVEVFELAFELACHKQMLSFLVHSEQIIIIIRKFLKFDLVETKGGEAAQRHGCSQSSASGEETLLRGVFRPV